MEESKPENQVGAQFDSRSGRSSKTPARQRVIARNFLAHATAPHHFVSLCHLPFWSSTYPLAPRFNLFAYNGIIRPSTQSLETSTHNTNAPHWLNRSSSPNQTTRILRGSGLGDLRNTLVTRSCLCRSLKGVCMYSGGARSCVKHESLLLYFPDSSTRVYAFHRYLPRRQERCCTALSSGSGSRSSAPIG